MNRTMETSRIGRPSRTMETNVIGRVWYREQYLTMNVAMMARASAKRIPKTCRKRKQNKQKRGLVPKSCAQRDYEKS